MRRNTKTMYEWRKVYRDKEVQRGFGQLDGDPAGLLPCDR